MVLFFWIRSPHLLWNLPTVSVSVVPPPHQKKLEAIGFQTESELDEQIKKLTTSLKRSRAKDLGIEFEEEKQEVPDFSLVATPDHQLDEEGIKEKRKQRLLKAGYDARIRMKEEKLEVKRREEEERRKDEEFRKGDIEGWKEMMRRNWEVSFIADVS